MFKMSSAAAQQASTKAPAHKLSCWTQPNPTYGSTQPTDNSDATQRIRAKTDLHHKVSRIDILRFFQIRKTRFLMFFSLTCQKVVGKRLLLNHSKPVHNVALVLLLFLSFVGYYLFHCSGSPTYRGLLVASRHRTCVHVHAQSRESVESLEEEKEG